MEGFKIKQKAEQSKIHNKLNIKKQLGTLIATFFKKTAIFIAANCLNIMANIMAKPFWESKLALGV